MESNGPQKTAAKSLWHVVRAVYYMLLKGVWKRSLALDLHLLFKRGKIAGGRALSGLLTAHHHNHHHHHHSHQHGHEGRAAALFDVAAFSAAFSCRSMDPASAVYVPREVEFSCSNTPSFPFLHRKDQRRHQHRDRSHRHRSSRHDSSSLYNYDAAAIARVFEVLNSDPSTSTGAASDIVASSSSSSSSPALFARSPHRVRQLRVTDSPYPEELEEDLEAGCGGVDTEAEEFIRWFREQLRSQTYAATPEYGYGDHWS